MTVKTVYRSQHYPTLTGREPRFVRAMHYGGYAWCIRQPDGPYDIRQGTADAGDVPADIRAKADALLGHAFSYVEWPQ